MPRKTDLDKLRDLQAQKAELKKEEEARRLREKELKEATAKVLNALLVAKQQEVGELAYKAGLIPLDADGVPAADLGTLGQALVWLAAMLNDPERWDVIRGMIDEPCTVGEG